MCSRSARKKLGPRLAVVAEHGRGHVHEQQTLVLLATGCDQGVGLTLDGEALQPAGAGLDGEDDDLGVGQRGLDELHESVEIRQHLRRGLARGDVVVAGVEHDDARGILRDDPRREVDRIGQLRAAEAAVDRRQVGEGLRQLPHADGGAADENDGVARGRVGAILRLESGDGLLPAGKRLLVLSRAAWRSEHRQQAEREGGEAPSGREEGHEVTSGGRVQGALMGVIRNGTKNGDPSPSDRRQ